MNGQLPHGLAWLDVCAAVAGEHLLGLVHLPFVSIGRDDARIAPPSCYTPEAMRWATRSMLQELSMGRESTGNGFGHGAAPRAQIR